MWTLGFISLGYTPGSRIPGAYGTCTFNLLRNFQVFPQQLLPFTFPGQYMRFRFFYQCFSLILTVLVSVKWYLMVALIRVAPVTTGYLTLSTVPSGSPGRSLCSPVWWCLG